jgi:signal transduction histidine kinase
MKRFRFGIAFRLLAGLTSLVLLTAGAGSIALLALNGYQRALDEVAQQHLPALASSATLVQQTQKLVATAPTLILAESQIERRGLMIRISAQKDSIDQQLEALRRFGLGAEESAAISRVQADLVENLSDLDAAVEHKIDQDRRMQDLTQELRQLRERIHGIESSHLADGGVAQLRDAASDSPLTGPAARLLIDREIAAQDWLGRSDEILALLLTASDAQNRGALDSIRVQLLDAIDRITTIGRHLPDSEQATASGIVAELGALGLDAAGLLETRSKQLETARTVQLALGRNRSLADQLVAAVSGPQQRISREALELGAAASRSTRQTAQNLIAIVLAGVVAAGVILVYIFRSVIRRLYRLQLSMQGRQAGRDTPIDTDGRDEIAEMAQALDFFVRTISEREAETERALVDLKAAQASLIHAEKLASLGQLTAGIAHEIKNPLNFVNNFAALSLELCDELREALSAGDRGGQNDAVRILTGNLAKIRDHGKRADSIVRSMLLHSRQGHGEPELVDFNALVEEAILLADHGAQVQDPNSRVTIERHFEPRLGAVELVVQDITRVLLNILANAFYAVAHRRPGQAAEGGPLIGIATSGDPERAEVRIYDNGPGMTKETLDQMFIPFFTTKPTGEGTGLGLSLSYDIVHNQHKGRISAESVPGRRTMITVSLPRRYRAETPRPVAAFSAE